MFHHPKMNQISGGTDVLRGDGAAGAAIGQAGAQTGVSYADFSRIRGIKLNRFTFGRLLLILEKLGQHAVVSVAVAPRCEAVAFREG